MDEQQRQTTALFRFRVIAPLLEPDLTPAQCRQRREEILGRAHPLVGGEGSRRISARTLRRWLHAWRQGGFQALYPKTRRDAGTLRAFPAEVLARAAELRRQVPERSTERLIEILTDPSLTADPVPPAQLRRSTLARHLRRLGLSRRDVAARPTGFRRFEQARANLLWMGDGLDGPYLPDPVDPQRKRQTHLLAWLDDHSRFVPAALWAWSEDLLSVLASFRRALLRAGLPLRVYLDRGPAYKARQFELICAQLGIRVVLGTPGHKEGRGKIERFWGTVQSGFLPELRAHPVADLAELQALFDAWLDRYHHRTHSETGEPPLARWERYRSVIRFPDPLMLAEAFLFTRQAKVDQTGVFQLCGNRYETDLALCRQRVTVRYDPLDLRRVHVSWQGRTYQARPLQLHRHTDPEVHVPVEHQASLQATDYLGALHQAYAQQIRAQLGGLRFAQRIPPPEGGSHRV